MSYKDYLDTVQKVYIAFYERPADPIGLIYWAERLDAENGNLDAIIEAFANSDEAKALYGTIDENTIGDVVDKIYQASFNRAPDSGGKDFYVKGFKEGKFTAATIMLDILNGAQNDDKVILEHKIESAMNFTKAIDPELDGKALQATYDANDIQAARDYLKTVDKTVDTVKDSNDAISYVREKIADAGDEILHQGISLTVNSDNVTGNVFYAHRAWNPGGTDQLNTLNDDDVLTGIGDNPTLNFDYVTDTETGDYSIMPELKNIETINVNFDVNAPATTQPFPNTATLDLQDSNGVKNINVNRIDNNSNVLFDNIQEALETVTIANTNANNTDNVGFKHAAKALKGSDDKVDVTLNNVQIRTIQIDDYANEGYETINLKSTGSNNSVNQFIAQDLQTLNISGDTNLTLGGTAPVVSGTLTEAQNFTAGLGNVAGSLTEVNASKLEANLTYHIGAEINATKDSDGNPVQLKVVSGKGDDTFVLTNGNNIDAATNNTDTIDGGEGDNKLIITGGAAQSISAPASGANIKNIQTLDIRTGHDTATTADNVTVDADAFDSLENILVRNEGQTGLVSSAEAMTVNLNDLTVNQAKNITIFAGTTGNNGITNNTIISDVKTNTNNDSLGITIKDALNTNPRFNFALQDTANTSYENVTITDSDSESNTIRLASAANYTGTITLKGGASGTFINLDVNTAGTGGVYGKDTTGSASDSAFVQDLSLTAGTVRLVASTIDASQEKSDVIVRVSEGTGTTGAQTIKLGSGNDTVVFDALNNTTGGLSVSDHVDAGSGNDVLALDGNGVRMELGASEWTNVKGFDTIRLVGNVQTDVTGLTGTTFNENAKNAYNLILTDALIDNNASDGAILNIINDNGKAASGVNSVPNSGVTIDLTRLSSTNSINYDGQETNNAGTAVITDDTTMTDDRFIFDDATLNGLAKIDGGADVTTAVAGTVNAGHKANNDVMEIKDTAVVTVGDLANIKNVSNIVLTNDQATDQTIKISLNNNIVDNLVNSTKAADNTSALNNETLTIKAFDNAAISDTIMNLDASQITNQGLNLDIQVGSGANTLKLGAGTDYVHYLTVSNNADTIYNFKAGTDKIVLSEAAFKNDDLDGDTSNTGTGAFTVDTNQDGTNDALALAAAAFAGTTATANKIWYTAYDSDGDTVADSIHLYADNTGDTTADFQVNIIGITSIAATDILVQA